jgi:hypothetical protein
MTRRQIREVIEGARDGFQRWGDAVAGSRQLSDEELLTRYEQFHRGKPEAVFGFIQRMAPEGVDPYEAAIEYEREMEALVRRRDGKRG